jgi:GNAT superfamily N-acetyltransferase
MPNDVEQFWNWELTPAEIFSGVTFGKSEPVRKLGIEVKPFACEKQALEGTPFEFQLALSDSSKSPEIQRLRRAHPELPLSGDRRGGVLVFDGPKIIGNCIVPGLQTYPGYRMVVHPDYRQQQLAFRMLLEWCRYTKRPKTLPLTGVTVISSKAWLAVHSELVKWAVKTGRHVPEHVLAAIASGEEARRILQRATDVENMELPKAPKRKRFLTRFAGVSNGN